MKLNIKKIIAREMLIFLSVSVFIILFLFLRSPIIKLYYSFAKSDNIPIVEIEIKTLEHKLDSLNSERSKWRPRINEIKDSVKKVLQHQLNNSQINLYELKIMYSPFFNEYENVFAPIEPEYFEMRRKRNEVKYELGYAKKRLKWLNSPEIPLIVDSDNYVEKFIILFILIAYPFRGLYYLIIWSIRTLRIKE